MATTPEQQRESAEFVKQFTGIGAEMADFSLNDLENRMNSEINQTKIDALTDAEYRQVIVLAQKLGPLMSEEPAIDAYNLASFQNDFKFLAEFFNDPLKTEIITAVNAVDAVKFVEVKTNFKTAAAHVRAQRARAAQEHLSLIPDRLNNEQRNLFRNVPEIGTIVTQVTNEMEPAGQTLDSAAARNSLIELVTAKAYEELVGIYEGNMRIITQVKQQQTQEDLNAQINDRLGVRVEGVVGANNIMEHAGNARRLLFGEGGYEDINQNPLITAVLSPTERQQFNDMFIMAASSEEHGSNIPDGLRDLVRNSVTRIMGQSTVADVAVHFHKLDVEVGSHPNPEVIKRNREIMVAKLKTVPKHWQNTEEAQKYEDYVLANGVDSYDFEGAMDRGFLGKVSFIRKIMMMLKGLWSSVKGAFSDEEDLEQWERIQHYKGDVEDGEGDVDPAAVAAGQGVLTALQTQVEAVHGAGSLNIAKNGAPLDVADNNDAAAITEISNKLSFDQYPERLKLLTQGIELNDLVILAQNVGDQDADSGFNVEFTDSGFTMSYDIQNYIGGLKTNALLGVGAGGAAAAAFTAVGFWWAAAIGAGAIGVAHMTGLDQIDSWDTAEFDYDDLSPQRLHAAIEEMQADVGLINDAFENIDAEKMELFVEDFASHQDKFDPAITTFAPGLFSDAGFSPAFESMLSLGDDFWKSGGVQYQMTEADLNNFAGDIDHAWWDFNGDIDNEENAIFGENGNYKVQGSGTWYQLGWGREGVSNAQEFFDWLRERNA